MEDQIFLHTDIIWNRDQLGYCKQNTICTFSVPIVNNQKDKVIFFVDHNDFWNSSTILSAKINDTEILFTVTKDNPHARYYNSKPYQRYYGADVSSSLIAVGTRFLTLQIDLTGLSNFTLVNEFYFRYLGSHDKF